MSTTMLWRRMRTKGRDHQCAPEDARENTDLTGRFGSNCRASQGGDEVKPSVNLDARLSKVDQEERDTPFRLKEHIAGEKRNIDSGRAAVAR